ncbi:MAG: lipopolysaccharide biosynthesis protein [Candidatus Bathyarchaeia archaeon]
MRRNIGARQNVAFLRRILALFKEWASQKGFFYVTLGQYTFTAFGALFWFVAANLLQVATYGSITFLFAIGTAAASLSILGLNYTIMTYYPKEHDDELLRQSCLLTSLVAIVASIAIIIWDAFLPESLLILVPYVFATIAFLMTVAIELGKRNYLRYLYLYAAYGGLKLVLGVAFYFLYGLPGVIVGFTIPALLMGYRYIGSLRNPDFSFRKVREKLNFTLHSFGSGTVSLLLYYTDKILIRLMFGELVLGLYQLAFQFYLAFSMVPYSLFYYLLPEEAGGRERREVKLLGYLTTVGIVAFGVFGTPWVVRNFFPRFEESVLMVQVASFAIIPATIAQIRSVKYFASEKPRRVLLAYSGALLVELVAFSVLGNLMGTLGLPVALIVTQSTIALLLL